MKNLIKQIGFWFQRFLLLCLAVVIAFNVSLLIKRLVYKEELPSLFGYSMVTVLSGSMEPEFSPGDVLIIRKQGTYGVGDVVTYRDQNSFITHRIVEMEGERFITRGDANNAPDGTAVSARNIFGKVNLIVPWIGNMLLFFRSSLGILVLVLLCLFLVELPHLMNGRDEKKSEQT